MRRTAAAVLAAATVAAMASAAAPPSSAGAAGRHASKPVVYYLSLGDSYSVGYQPGMGNTAGYTAYVAKKTKTQLENFGCGGATTTSIGSQIGCNAPAAFDPVPYPTETQLQAALDFIAAHPGQVGLVTVSIGGNDVTACARASDPVSCVATAVAGIQTNVTALAGALGGALTSAGDSSAHIVGLTYPDVILGDYVYPPGSPNVSLANLSITAFDLLINPALQKAYTSVSQGSFVNVTSAPYKKATSGDDTGSTSSSSPTPQEATTKLKPYGVIPDAVWEVCKLTYFCSEGNIHANTKGYDFIGHLIVADLASL
ncbi:MAG TPA: SGNH/GDSL hydrolase family protein [Acidimicrobiales bacterium]|nr:SGNH/GDSL hydrolase family protein [Acidimicrobiales bacterium]